MIVNGSFEAGLTGWTVVSGRAFADQPVAGSTILAKDVRIDGRPVVPLGGDYWHDVPYPVGQDQNYLVQVVSKLTGVLDSDEFVADDRYLCFLLGGSPAGDAAVELRVDAMAVARAGGFKALDQPDANGYVAVIRAVPSGSDVLAAVVWDLRGKRGGLIGASARIRLTISKAGPHRLLVDAFELRPDRPPDRHRPLWGWADLHCHPMAQAGFGGLMHGHMHGPVEDLGTCVLEHGVNHANTVFHPVPSFSESARGNDGSLTAPGWTITTPEKGEQLVYAGWPSFDDLTHIKVHQDWIRRAWEGGQRLMVALIVHSELLSNAMLSGQTDRDTVEPQIRMLKEFVAHNGSWCGLAFTPGDARTLIEAGKLAFILGLETDSINGWVRDDMFPSDPTPANRDAIHAVIHPYFAYLRNLGVIQVNLLHLSDNAFGGMALYDWMFMFNTFTRTGTWPTPEDGFDHRPVDDQISRKVTTSSTVWGHLQQLAINAGFPPPFTGPWTPNGDRNTKGLTLAGEVAVLEAMRFGMVIDLDHMSEKSAATAHKIATGQPGAPSYPLVSAHNGARRMAPRALDPATPSPAPMTSEFRRSSHVFPNENNKSAEQLGWIKDTKGIFGHGTAGADSRAFPATQPVTNDCPGSDKTFAQGYQFVLSQLEAPVGFGTDWNSLLEGPGPRFGPRSAHALWAEAGATLAGALRAEVLEERRHDADAQIAGVIYGTPVADFRRHRFDDPGLYFNSPLEDVGHLLWQAIAIHRIGIDVDAADALETLAEGVRETVLGIDGKVSRATSQLGQDMFTAGTLFVDNPANAAAYAAQTVAVKAYVDGLRAIDARWSAMTTAGGTPAGGTPLPPQTVPLTRSTAGPVREFDYNLDGLAHYGMLPDMLQDLHNVGFPASAMSALFGSAERYVQVWELSDSIGAALPHP